MSQLRTTQDFDARLTEYKNILDQYIQSPDVTFQINEMIRGQKTRLTIDLDPLRRKYPTLVQDLVRNPTELLNSMQETLQQVCDTHPDFAEQGYTKKNVSQTKKTKYRIAFAGNLGRNYVTPRGLGACMVNQLVATQGIVTKMSLVRPKIVQSVHYVEKTNKNHVLEYDDNMDAAEKTKLNQKRVVPKKDEDGNPMMLEFGFSQFRDYQNFVIQELPERTPIGLLPRSVEVLLDTDLVDSVKPGDRITIYGIYKSYASSSTQNDGSLKTVLIALSVGKIQQEQDNGIIDELDKNEIENISRRPDVLEFLSKSIAPSIHGHKVIKQALLLQLVGGSEKNLSTGTHLRGDINILMIGDPSTAKSQMLRYIMGIAPLSVTTTGRGSSSVGLTAAVKRDPETNENVLEAGAMVLADGGIVLIDEFDKMNEADRVAIHEVMEQQTVTIAKAGIHCTLNARCSVVAAANPVYGEYQTDLPPTRNINLPDSLLSRFDLLFIVLDEKNPAHDKLVAQRVIKNHRHRGANLEEQNYGDIITPLMNLQIKQEKNHFIQYSSALHTEDQKNSVTQSLLKKYIAYVKQNYNKTILDENAIERITQIWVDLRQKELSKQKKVQILPVTIRSLESLIRLASAHAKLRLSSSVTLEDCEVAGKLMRFSLQEEDFEEKQSVFRERERDRSGVKIKYEEKRKEEQQEMADEGRGVYAQEAGSQTGSGQKERRSERQKKKKQTEDEPRLHLDLQVAGQMSITRDQTKIVFKTIFDILELSGSQACMANEIWECIERDERLKSKIESYSMCLKCLIELDAQGKIQFDRKKLEVLKL